jgi:archaemetzincin
MQRRTWLRGALGVLAASACERREGVSRERGVDREGGGERERGLQPGLGDEPAPALPSGDEPPQSLADFLAEPRRPLAGDARVLELLPIGEFPRGFVVEYERVHLVRSPELALLAALAQAWFGLPVRVLAPLSDALLESLPAREFEGRRQLDAEALLDRIEPLRSRDAHALLALTLDDLWAPSLAAQWVFGVAASERGVAIHSMLRYDPGLRDAGDRPADFERIVRARAMRVLVHELGHLLGMRHCLYFRCVMNPTEGIADLDALPLHLCTICTQKLLVASGVDPRMRALALREFFDEQALLAEREFIDRTALR